MFEIAGEVVIEQLREKQLRTLQYQGVQHKNYVAFAKKLIQEMSQDADIVTLKNVFRSKSTKAQLLWALADQPDAFPELSEDLTRSSLYYFLSLRASGYGENQNSESLRELRVIQEAGREKSAAQVHALLNDGFDVWNAYEYLLRVHRMTEDRSEYLAGYQKALLSYLGSQKGFAREMNWFVKAYEIGAIDGNYFHSIKGIIKKLFKHYGLNDALFIEFADKLLSEKRFDTLIALVAAADRRTFLEKYISTNESVLECLDDEKLRLFSGHKLRPLLKPAEQEETKKSGVVGLAFSLFPFAKKPVPSKGGFEMRVVRQ